MSVVYRKTSCNHLIVQQMKYYFPLHFDGGNRGCEAIAKGTSNIIGANKEDMIAYCRNIPLDTRLGLSELYTLVPKRKLSFTMRVQNKIHSMFVHDEAKTKYYCYPYEYNGFLNLVGDDDVMLSTGGDMLCYNDNEVNYTVNYLAERKRKTVLWGCSVGEANLTPDKIDALRKFSLVVPRESLTEKLFERLGLKNIRLFPDPAFGLKPEECELPDDMQDGSFIGINLSNFVGYDVSGSSLVGKNLRNLLSYILKRTKKKVMFIPHVLWGAQNDKAVCITLMREFNQPDRLFILDSEKYNYCQIRYIISKCEMFIGARTHAVISAYSTCVPTLALGYSVKSKGIAKDLSLPDYTVVNSVGVTHADEMSSAFETFVNNSDKIRLHLERVMPEYVSRLNEEKGLFSDL